MLTKAYRAVYGDADGVASPNEPLVLALRTAPLASSEEVIGLFQAQLLPCEHAVKASLHALGVSPDAIDKAVVDLCAKETQEHARDDEARAQQQADAALVAEERKVKIEATRAQTEVVKKEAAGMRRPPASGDAHAH